MYIFTQSALKKILTHFYNYENKNKCVLEISEACLCAFTSMKTEVWFPSVCRDKPPAIDSAQMNNHSVCAERAIWGNVII